jgi:hypothetical protein
MAIPSQSAKLLQLLFKNASIARNKAPMHREVWFVSRVGYPFPNNSSGKVAITTKPTTGAYLELGKKVRPSRKPESRNRNLFNKKNINRTNDRSAIRESHATTYQNREA